jgi:hypothetical protein
MSGADNLFASTQGYALRQALKELGKIYGVKDSNSFMQILLRGTQGGIDGANTTSEGLATSVADVNSELEEVADALLSLQGDGIFTNKMVEIFENFISGNATDELADHFSTPPSSDHSCVLSITTPNSHGLSERGYLRRRSVSEVLGLGAFEENDQISIVEMHHPNLNFGNRDTMSSSIFLQALPSIEISKAVPFLDMKVIVKNAPTTNENNMENGATVFSNGISIYKFLNGEKIEPDNAVILDLVSGVPMEFRNPPPVLDGVSGSLPAEKPMPSVAGMEIFTTPQTLVDGTLNYVDLDASASNFGPNADPQDIPLENKVLDKFRPLLTMESWNVQVTPATGMLATKAANVKLKLHEKTRMSQVQPLLVPSQLGDVEFLCEWGWSHPVSDPEINPYGALINSMRVREKYGLMNSSYTFTPDGQVDIDLKLYTKGAQKATFELVSNDPSNKHPSDVLKDLIMAIRTAMRELKQEGFTLNSEMGAPDVLGKASSVGGLLSLDEEQLASITSFIDNMSNSSSGTSSSDEWENLSNSWSSAQAGITDFKDKVEEIFLGKIEAVAGTASRETPDPYLVTDSATIDNGVSLFNITHDTHVSFAKILLYFLAEPIRSTGRFDEIQLVFYPMNEYSMWARGLDLGQYPINKSTFKDLIMKELQLSPSVSIQKFLNMMKKLFLNFLGDDIYGLSTFYGTDDDGKRVVNEQYTKDEEGKQLFASKKQKVMEACYGREGEKRFKKPNVQMFVECVANVEEKNSTILRLHFFDKNTTSYSSYASLWQATSASDMGVIGKYVNADRSLKKAQESPPAAGSNADAQENWEELIEERANRKTDYEGKARTSMDYFVQNGLVEEFMVHTTQTNDQGEEEEGEYPKYRIKGGPDQLRGILAANMPTLKYGTEYSGILNASLATQSNPAMETIHMQRQSAGGGTPTGAVDDGLPMTIKPVQLSLDTFGCPFINFGQQFFVDFQTNTTIDDIYAVSGVQHSLTPSEFKSSIKLMPLNKLGQFRSMVDQFDDAMAVARDTGDNTSNS